MPLSKRDPNDKRNFVIIGGGAAGLNCAETLRQSGYTGKITLISNEKTLPYDRTLLTKTLPFGDASKFVLRDDQYLKSADIDVKLGYSVYSIHTDKKKVVCSNGRKYDYDKLCIATGGQAIKPPISGLNDAKNVFYLRNKAD